jgi:hypothetical protein
MAFDDDYDDSREPYRVRYDPATWPQSGIGIASFICGIVSLFLFAGAIGVVLVTVVRIGNARHPPQALVALTGLMIVASGFIALLGTGLGIGGCCQRDRKKVFAILGLVINLVLLMVGAGIMLYGLAMRSTH